MSDGGMVHLTKKERGTEVRLRTLLIVFIEQNVPADKRGWGGGSAVV